jgi:hypothetical protein
MTFQEILNALREGKVLSMSFPNPMEREKFRVRLYKKKKPEDTALEAILNEEKKVLRWESEDVTGPNGTEIPSTKYNAKFWLENKPSDDNFEVQVIDG